MQNLNQGSLSKKSVTVNDTKLKRVKRMLKTRNDSETIRFLIDKELALQAALEANQQLRLTGGARPIMWR